MKLIWKLAIPQIIIVILFSSFSFIIVNSSFTNLTERHVKDVIEGRFLFIKNEIDIIAKKTVEECSVFVRLPAVMEAYKIALSGDIYNSYSPESQTARDLLRKELAVMLDSHREITGEKLMLHFHLPNGYSLVRLWRDKNTKINGEWVDISDDVSSFRLTVMDVNRNGNIAMGVEPGSGGFTIRGVIPVKAPDGKLLGSAEILQEFDPILSAASEDKRVFISSYVNSEVMDFSIELQDREKYPVIGNFIQIIEPKNSSVKSLITPQLLTKGKDGVVYEDHGSMVLATYPLSNYRGNQIGVIVCAMSTEAVSALANRAALILALTLAFMAFAPALILVIRMSVLVTIPLNSIKAKIQDIAEDRADLGEKIPCSQKDEIGELAVEFNALADKLDVILCERQDMFSKIRRESEKYEKMEHWYISILDSMPFQVSVMDMDMKWTFINSTAEKFTGKKRCDVMGLPCFNSELEICNTDKCAITCAKRRIKQTHFSCGDLSFQVDIEMIRGLRGEAAGYVEIIQDITKLELLAIHKARAEVQLIQDPAIRI